MRRRTWFIVLSTAVACGGGGSIGTVGSGTAQNGVLAQFQAACNTTCMHWASCPNAPISASLCALACNASAASGSSTSLGGGVRCADVNGALAQEQSCATAPCDQIASCLSRADNLCAGGGPPPDAGMIAEGSVSAEAAVVLGDDGGGSGGDDASGTGTGTGTGGPCDVCARAYACCVAELVNAGQPEGGAGTSCNSFSPAMCMMSNSSSEVIGTCNAVLQTGASLNLPACQ
jgi:hypothetical protein